MKSQIVVTNKAHLDALQNHIPGELAFVQETNEIYTWDEEKGWLLVEVDSKGIDFNLYDLNKSIINQLKPLDFSEIQEKEKLIADYQEKANSDYHMLLCRDYNYYTIFNKDISKSEDKFVRTVLNISAELGEIYSIDLLDDGAIEFWVKPLGQDAPYAFYLFPYDAGVVYYG